MSSPSPVPERRVSTKGWVDDGGRVGRQRCPRCRSTNFFQTVSRERCNDCGYDVDYWAGQVREE